MAKIMLAMRMIIDSIRNNTSSAVLATESNPMYEKKTVEAPASIPSTPNGKYLSVNMSNKKSENYY